MKERPILFSAPMVRAILDGRKSQTRREVKRCGLWESTGGQGMSPVPIACPHGLPGDRLWVRETWRQAYPRTSYSDGVVYKADAARSLGMDEYSDRHRWRPSIHMPRRASRITLDVTGVRVERLQDISESDAMAEGVPFTELPQGQDKPAPLHRAQFADLWESINGPGSWDANPWVWVIKFRRVP